MHPHILNTIGLFNSTEIKLFEAEVKQRCLVKGEVVLPEGDVAKSVYFLVEGAVYQTKPLSTSGSGTIIDLHLPNEWFLNQESLASQNPSDRDIIAFSDSVIFELTLASVHYLIQKAPAFLQLNKILGSTGFRMHLLDNLLTPMQKYLFILNAKPNLVQVFPLKIIASYLKVTPETLSRVRNELVKNNS